MLEFNCVTIVFLQLCTWIIDCIYPSVLINDFFRILHVYVDHRDVAQALVRSLDNSADLLTAHTTFPHSPGLAIISGRLANAGSGVGDIRSSIPHGTSLALKLSCMTNWLICEN